MDNAIECSLSECADDPRLGGAVEMQEGKDAIHRGLDRLERGACENLLRINNANCKYYNESRRGQKDD